MIDDDVAAFYHVFSPFDFLLFSQLFECLWKYPKPKAIYKSYGNWKILDSTPTNQPNNYFLLI
jgi:hypothetical protein